jgi:hypothetical protein
MKSSSKDADVVATTAIVCRKDPWLLQQRSTQTLRDYPEETDIELAGGANEKAGKRSGLGWLTSLAQAGPSGCSYKLPCFETGVVVET